ncbi:MAG: hypothetical protein WBX50_05885, partial [Candidatus Deferrimicrobiaceae bacterium]
MAGSDYGVFANGRWYLSGNIRRMHEWLGLALQRKEETEKWGGSKGLTAAGQPLAIIPGGADRDRTDDLLNAIQALS